MKAAATLRIHYTLEAAEEAALLGALDDLRSALAQSGHTVPTVETQVWEQGAILPTGAPTLVITSLSREMRFLQEPLEAVEERLRRELSALSRSPHMSLYLCTIFRRVDAATRRADHDAAMASVERIRRLNLLACELSHDFDLNVIDLDRAFADVGGRVLNADFQLRGATALALARRVILSTLLAAGLDDVLDATTQDQLRAVIERRGREMDDATKSGFSADRLGFGEAFGGPRLQRYAATSPLRRTMRTVLRNWRAGHVTSAETMRIMWRGIQGRRRRRRRH